MQVSGAETAKFKSETPLQIFPGNKSMVQAHLHALIQLLSSIHIPLLILAKTVNKKQKNKKNKTH